jgi:osmotically-inducible protein OsmY
MEPHRPYRLVAAGLLAALLCACAEYEAHRKCGAQGCSGDADITSAVEKGLAAAPALAAPNQVYVRTLDGTVYLSGKVATDLQRSSAEEIAQRTPGVRRVVDNIALEYSGR